MKTLQDILQLEDKTKAVVEIGELMFEKMEHYHDFSNLSDWEKTFMYIDILEEEVNNGGFNQFFFNYAGIYAHEALQAYKDIGAHKTAELIFQAIKIFPSLTIPKDMKERREILCDERNEHLDEEWGKIDDKFYLYEDDIVYLLIEYIKAKNIYN